MEDTGALIRKLGANTGSTHFGRQGNCLHSQLVKSVRDTENPLGGSLGLV
jgi:hypothetical protein